MNKKQHQTEHKFGSGIKKLENFDEKIKTYISHNKGASWELIRAPEIDMRG